MNDERMSNEDGRLPVLFRLKIQVASSFLFEENLNTNFSKYQMKHIFTVFLNLFLEFCYTFQSNLSIFILFATCSAAIPARIALTVFCAFNKYFASCIRFDCVTPSAS